MIYTIITYTVKKSNRQGLLPYNIVYIIGQTNMKKRDIKQKYPQHFQIQSLPSQNLSQLVLIKMMTDMAQ